ncbi:hypothetical protein CLERM_149 [Coxiella-like endosymbiont]|nr:hypothetical protein CLERM_811 [Coxiella-like endosymbiont]PMB55021.1 hypothetical protein CLERM_149 [Coxiella-like endosymbiont]
MYKVQLKQCFVENNKATTFTGPNEGLFIFWESSSSKLI